MDTIALLKILASLALPPASMAVGGVLGVVLALFGLRRMGLSVAALAVIETLVMSFPPVADALVNPLQDRARAEAAHAPTCCYEAIVVLGGGMTPAVPPFLMEPDLGDGADRVWYAAQLFHRGVARRIIVTGGSLLPVTGPAVTEAEAMRRFLIDLGVPSEANIYNVRQIVGDGRVALVTSGYHMPRALQIAKMGGLNVGAFPTDWRLPAQFRPSWENWIPSIAGMAWTSIGLREHAALILDRRGP